MERLTKRDGGGNAVVDCDVCELGESRLANCGVLKCRNRLKDRLAYYEDAEEQGRLIVLPNKERRSVSDILNELIEKHLKEKGEV